MTDSQMKIRLISVLVLLLIIVIFTVQNAAVVTISFLFWEFAISRALMIFFVFTIGVLAGWSFSVWLRHHRQH